MQDLDFLEIYFFLVEEQHAYNLYYHEKFRRYRCHCIFAQKPSIRGIGCTDFNSCEEQSILIFYNFESATLYNGTMVPLMNWDDLLGRTDISLFQDYQGFRFTAMGRVNNTGDKSRLPVYVAAGKAFSLFQFTSSSMYKYSPPEELITFPNPAASESIFHLQCLHGPNNDRIGIVVGRVDGDIELWDDRQPRGPSCVGKLYGVRPVVDTPSHSYLAAPMADNGAISVWHLQTGEVVKILEFPRYLTRRLSDFCSTSLVMRSRWSWGNSSWPLSGPILMAIQGRSAYFFY